MTEDPVDREDLIEQAVALSRQGRKEAAYKLVETWLGRDQYQPRDLDRAGCLLFQLGHLDKAEVCYRKVLDFDPDYLPVYNNLATLYIQVGRYEEAVELIRDGLERVARQRAGETAEAVEFDADESLDLLRQALGSERGRPEGEETEKVAAAPQEYDETSDLARRAAEMRPGSKAPLRITTAESAGLDDDERIASYETDRGGVGADDAGLLELAEAYGRKGNYVQALEACRRWLEANPADPAGYEFCGRLLMQLDRTEEALENFDEALKLDDGLESARLGKGEALLKLERYQEAYGSITELIDRGTETGEPYFLLARIALELNRKPEARGAFERALDLPVKLTPEYAQFIGMMFDLGVGELAVALAQDLVRSFPDDPRVTEEIGRHLPGLLS